MASLDRSNNWLSDTQRLEKERAVTDGILQTKLEELGGEPLKTQEYEPGFFYLQILSILRDDCRNPSSPSKLTNTVFKFDPLQDSYQNETLKNVDQLMFSTDLHYKIVDISNVRHKSIPT